MYKMYRMREGHTQEVMAYLLDISVRHYQRIENYHEYPSIDLVKKFAKILKLTNEEIGHCIILDLVKKKKK